MFRICMGKGFQLTFANGWTVSVQFGSFNYCENRAFYVQDSMAELDGNGPNDTQCPNAEIAAWDKDGKWFDFGGDEVKGWCTPDQVACFIAGIATGMGSVWRPEDLGFISGRKLV